MYPNTNGKSLEERITIFLSWAAERLEIVKLLYGFVTNDASCFWEKEGIERSSFDGHFKYLYDSISNEVSNLKYFATQDAIPEHIINDVLESYKQMKSKVRKTKAAYKRKLCIYG